MLHEMRQEQKGTMHSFSSVGAKNNDLKVKVNYYSYDVERARKLKKDDQI